jgi:ketosteroid isomerase-like protein
VCLVRFAPDYHYDAPPEWLIAGMPSVYRGHAGLREWAAELREAWEILDHTPLEVVDAGKGRPPGTDALVRGRYYVVCTVRNGRIASGREYETRAEAMEAVGLPGQETDAGP